MPYNLDMHRDLATKINIILGKSISLKARKLAHEIGVDRSELNSFLYKHTELYALNIENHEWSLVKSNELIINFPEVNWLDSETFEQSLNKAGSPLDSPANKVTFVIGAKSSIMLEAASRLLALCNQLVMIGKTVTVDFSATKSTLHYFDRCGFCDRLDMAVTVLPSRPLESKAKAYKGKNENLIEFGEINPKNIDSKVVEDLQKSFIFHAGKQFSALALTVISEPFNNVHDHSNSPINGFAALQKYQGNQKHIQTVISDSGVGIAGSLRPVLQNKYLKLEKKFSPRTIKTDILLIKEVFEKGGISQVDDDDRGLGLNRTFELAVKYNANISIRQENFELKIYYRNGVLKNFLQIENLVKILGTHFCFDFFLDKTI